MGARQRLVLLAGVSGTVLILLGRTAHGAAEQLAKVPPQSWGLSELSDAVVAGTRERLEDAGASASERETTLAEARGRVGLVRAGMEEFARLLVDRAA